MQFSMQIVFPMAIFARQVEEGRLLRNCYVQRLYTVELSSTFAKWSMPTVTGNGQYFPTWRDGLKGKLHIV